MALPSLASRPPPARREPVALVGSETVAPAPPPAARDVARVKAILAEQQRQPAGAAGRRQSFSGARRQRAARARLSQVLLARWMGSFEFGIYIYVWTWVLMIGALSDVGLSSAARRFIPEYTELKAARPLARISLRQPLARLRHRHRHRLGRRHRRDVCWRPCSIASPWCRSISPASPFRSTAWCRCRPASRNPTTGPIWR